MKLLVVLAAVLTVCSACGSWVPGVHKAVSFNCPAPNGKGLQAAFDQFDKFREEDLPSLADSYALRKIVAVFFENFPQAGSEWTEAFERLQTFFCEKVFLDGQQYLNDIFGVAVFDILIIESNDPIPPIEESQFREDFYMFVNKIHSSERYKRSREILDYHIAHDGYAQLGMEELNSAEMKKLIEDVMASGPFPEFVKTVESYGINPDDVVDLFVYFTLSIWDYAEK